MPWFVRNVEKKAPLHSSYFGWKQGGSALKWTTTDKKALWTSSRQGAENLVEMLKMKGEQGPFTITHETGGKY